MLNDKIEQTILKVDTTTSDIKDVCKRAVSYGFFGVCVPPYYVKIAKNELKDSNIKVITVIGFPMGYSTTSAKVEEAKRAIDEGADELDMVMNIAAFKSEDYNYVKNDIQSLATIVRMKNRKLKVIIETGVLTNKEIQKACEICVEEQVDFVKTSTGFNGKGASESLVSLMVKSLPSSIQVKASGGIKEKRSAESLVNAGATRIGTSSGDKLI